MGADQLLPLRQRRKALKDAFGFECGCARCLGEAAAFERVGGTVEAVAAVSRSCVVECCWRVTETVVGFLATHACTTC